MQLVVFEDAGYQNLLPLVYSRATFNLRCGCDNLLAKIETAFGRIADGLFVRESLAAVMDERQRQQFPRPRPVNRAPDEDDQLWVNGRLFARQAFDLPAGSAAWTGDALLAARIGRATAAKLSSAVMLDPAAARTALSGLCAAVIDPNTASLVEYPWQLVHANEAEITRQAGAMPYRRDGRVDTGAHLLGDVNIRIGAGSRIKATAVLDAENGPICIGDQVQISPHATITGPCYIGDGCFVRPGASIGGSSIGPVCKVGGEIEATIIHAYSNKQHDGFLGHSYIGEWANLGADTINSDLKNTYGPVQVPINGRPVNTESMFVGAFIGDHTKTGIRAALPTGCVIGYACSVFTSRYVPKFLPSFSWLTDDGLERNDPLRAADVAAAVMSRRKRTLSTAERALFLSIAGTAAGIEK